MKVNTKIFGEVEIEDEKIVEFPNGIIGFPDLKLFTLIFDEDKGVNAGIRWLQSVEEPSFAMPVMDPLKADETYNPSINDELLKPLGNLESDNMLVLVTVTVPREIEKMSVNLRGPIIINVEERKAVQIIVDGEEYPVKFPVYEIFRARKEGK